MLRKIFLALILCSSVFCSLANAQDCSPPKIIANAKSANIFTPDQEMVFGEMTIENMADEIRFVRDEKLLAYVKEIGDRLIKHLPPTGLRFQFHLIDIPEANAFNIPGGHVLVSRKLIAFAANEDELASVIAHELGHAVVRHSATDVSESLRKVLNITELGDRKDIREKYNLLIERARTKRLSRTISHLNEQQLEADRIGHFAMVAAGYDPAAFFTFFDRLTESEGRTGSWFSELFGTTRPEQKRLREISRATEQLPMACREGRAARATESYLKWQAEVVSFRDSGRKEELPGLLWKKELAPKLRGDVMHFNFSRDGKFLLAQDDFSITVIERDPLRVLFQISVDDAKEASFTPDGAFVIFTTDNLRYEKWSVAEKKPVAARELVLRRDCWEHKLSPDGNYLACVDTSTAVNVVDTRTGKKIWEQKEFYRLSWLEYYFWRESAKSDDDLENLFRIQFSPDSRFVMFSRSDRYRVRVTSLFLTELQSENTALALDLTTLKPVSMGGDVKKLASRPYLFLDAGRVFGMPSKKMQDSGIFSFPEGKRLQRFSIGALEFKSTMNPDYVIVKPLANARLGIFDLKKGIIAAGFNKQDATLWNNLIAFESVNGKVLLREVIYNEADKRIDGREVGSVEIPVGSLKNLDAAEVSNTFNWLLLSSKTRGGLWHLETGERKLYLRNFRGGVLANDGRGIGDFPKLDDVPHGLALMNPHDNSITPVRDLPEKGARQHGRFVLLRTSLTQKKASEPKKSAPDVPVEEETDDLELGQDVRFELKDIVQDKIIWSRDFLKEAPEFSFDEFGGRLIFYWRLGSEAGKAKLKETPALQAKAAELGNKADDYLLEIVDAFAQKTIGLMLLETGKGSFSVGKGLSEGNWLVLRDSEGRVLVYSIVDGQLRHRFFGKHAAINPKRNQIAVENFSGEVALYDLDSGDKEANFIINGSAAFIRFNLDGDKLFVLSDAQSAYAFNLNNLASGTQTGAK